MKDELGAKIMIQFVGPIPKVFSYLTYGCGGDKQAVLKNRL